MRVYVAGLYSRNKKGEMASTLETFENMRNGLNACMELLNAGHDPFCPWLDYLWFLLPGGEKITEKRIKQYSLNWVGCCEAIVLLDGWQKSPGSNDEFSKAIDKKVRSYHGVKAFLDSHPKG